MCGVEALVWSAKDLLCFEAFGGKLSRSYQDGDLPTEVCGQYGRKCILSECWIDLSRSSQGEVLTNYSYGI